DYQSAEWNTAALGPTKRILADDLIRRLRDRFAPGGLLHYGQGKWYPGEELPRWAFSLFWRRDGVPIWTNPRLIALEKSTRPLIADDAQRFTEAVAARLGITAEHVLPAFEDPAERMLKEGELPENIDPADPKIDDPVERSRIMRTFERHLSAPSGYVLPVQRWSAKAGGGWISEVWQLRRRRLFLIPGDSPIGFRLPLESLPYLPPVDYPQVVPADPFEERSEAPSLQRMSYILAERAANAPPRLAALRRPDAPAARRRNPMPAGRVPVRTALAVEQRDGRLCAFMPPVERLEDYLELIAAVEATAADLDIPVHVEGY